MRLSENVFYSDDKNPFEGDLGKAIKFDQVNVSVPVQRHRFGQAQIMPVYEFSASHVVEVGNIQGRDWIGRIADLGCGTGASLWALSRETQYQAATTRFVGVDSSAGMLALASYKFGKPLKGLDEKGIEDMIARYFGPRGGCPDDLRQYWENFRADVGYRSDSFEFVKGDVEDLPGIFEEGSINRAVAAQVLHWTDLNKVFSGLGKVLTQDGFLLWSSNSKFYNDSEFPALEYGFRYNHLVGMVAQELDKMNLEVADYTKQNLPHHTQETLNGISMEHGFETVQVGRYLVKNSLPLLWDLQVPRICADLITQDLSDEEKEVFIHVAMGKVRSRVFKEYDNQRIYDIGPILVSRRPQEK